MRTLTTLLSALALTLSPLGAMAGDHTQYADPFVGGANTGHTFPGACVPFGMIQASPVTGGVGWNYCSEYINSDSVIWGFSQTHLNGTGCMDLGDVLISPFTANAQRKDYRSSFRKETETAAPGYYAVTLDDAHVRAEVTAAPHVAVYRFTYERTDSAGIVVDLQHGPAWNEKQYHSHVIDAEVNVDSNPELGSFCLSGHVRNSVWVEQDYWFAISPSCPVKEVRYLPMARGEKGKRIALYFDTSESKTVEVTVSMSSASQFGALRNLSEVMPEQISSPDDFRHYFDRVRQAADDAWESYLSRIEVKGSDEQKRNFYTAFYHALIQPNNIADVDGSYRDSKGNPAVCEEGKEYYSTFSCWDTYRAAHPFYTLVVPDKVDAIVRSMIWFAESEGHLPIWGLWGRDNYCMVANHACSIVAEAYHKGFRGFDAERAFQAIKQTETVSHPLKSNWEVYTKYGYFPTDLTEAESVSSTLESVYDDYAAADMARLLGKTDDQAYFAERATWHRHLFDPETRFMRPRLADGSWKTPFDPAGLAHAESSGGDYTEGNAWQYTWHVQHDVPWLIEAMGGKKAFLARLDEFFNTKLESNLADVTGLIGQYAHGNEPSHHVAYLYALAGKPERTQELVREIIDTQYAPTPEGLCGNDDCGQMSAWYMLSAMGFYPVDPVSGEYVFGAPQLEEVVVWPGTDHELKITAKGLSKENLHVKKITLNGKAVKGPTISHDALAKGGQLVFTMGK